MQHLPDSLKLAIYIANPNFFIGFAIGLLLFGGWLVMRRGFYLFQDALEDIRILPKSTFVQNLRKAPKPMRYVLQVVVLWHILAARWNRLRQTQFNKRQDISAGCCRSVSLSETIKKHGCENSYKGSYYAFIHGLDGG